MDDLISRKAAIEYLMTNMGWCDEDGYQVDDADEKRTHIEDLMNGIPSVPAVPLDKLCELFAKNADCPPEHSPVQDHCIQAKCAKCWESVLKEWMEEQNGV